jgi:CheY-like chemotaxis protein
MPSTVPAAHLMESLLHPQDVHVLLVDDEQLSRLVVGNLLRKCEYKGEDELCRVTDRERACNASGRSYASADLLSLTRFFNQ